jgi:hypothetical protein
MTARIAPGIGQSLDSVPIPTLVAALARQGPILREQLLSEVAEAASSRGVGHDETHRVAMARTLVALLPKSLDLLADVLRGDDRRSHELQFSLFCFLGDHPQVQSDQRLRHQVLRHVESYLHSVRAPTGQAAWMAGDLLGDHWPWKEAIPVLVSVAKTARYVAGREGALHGLSHALDRADTKAQWEVMGTLRLVAETDRSKSVRSYATGIMGSLRGL